MFGRPSRSYLAAQDALEDGFRDAKAHQKKVFEAMRDALRLLLKELDPEEIAEALSEDRGLAVYSARARHACGTSTPAGGRL